MSQDVASNTVQSEADRWLARRQARSLRSDERADFERWLAKDPANRRAYNSSQALWNELAALQQDDELQTLARAAARPKRSYWRPLLMAASVAAVAIIGFAPLKSWMFAEPQFTTYATAVGEQRTVTLEDGSVVTLNTDTEIAAGFTRNERDLVLKRGEALFKVFHDAGRPFVVAADQGTVTALGTQFQVRRLTDAVTVTLLEGSVAVKQDRFADQRRMLQPGEQAEYRPTIAGIAQKRADLEVATSWTKGQLIFRDTPLAEAVTQVNRFSNQKLVVGPGLGGITVSGTFGTEEPASFATAVEAMFPIRAVHDADGLKVRLERKTAQ